MFYAHFVLAKKGPLAKVWLAAHWDRKLTKANVFETDVETTVETIISPKVKIALRTSGHLLLGVVRIYSRKAKYLLHDCSEAFAKIRMAFRPGVVDLPLETRAADSDVITFPELFKDFESAVADLNDLNIESQFALNQGQIDEITLPESSRDDFFAVGDFPSIEQLRQGSGLNEASFKTDTHQEEDSTLLKKQDVSDGLGWDMNYEQQPNLDDFGGDFDVAGLNLVDGIAPGDVPMEDMPPGDFLADELPTLDGIEDTKLQEDLQDQQRPQEDEEPQIEMPMEMNESVMPPSPAGQENFELEPVQAIVLKDRGRRKRKLVVDSRKQLTSDFIRNQLSDYSDTLQSKLFPPPTKKSMLWKKVASCDYLFANPTSYPFGSEIASLVTSKFSTKPPDLTSVPPEGAIETLRQEVENVSASIEESREILERLDKQPTPPVETSMPGWQEDYITDQPPVDLPDAPEPPADMPADFGDLPPIPELPDLDIPSVDNRLNEEFSEEFEEQRWGKRTRQVLSMLQHGFASAEDINFKALTKNCTRKMAASRFYTCLLLAKEGAITFDQSGAYQDIYISKGTKYEITV